MSEKQGGFSLLEVLVAAGALALLTLVGMRGLNVLIEQYARMHVREEEFHAIRDLGTRLQHIVDQRQDHRFFREPGIVLEGAAFQDGFHVRSVRLRTWLGDAGEAVWELSLNHNIWQERTQFSNAESDEVRQRRLTYTGRIVLKSVNDHSVDKGVFRRWTFPDAFSGRAQ